MSTLLFGLKTGLGVESGDSAKIILRMQNLEFIARFCTVMNPSYYSNIGACNTIDKDWLHYCTSGLPVSEDEIS